MKGIFITGAYAPALQQVAGTLMACGLEPAKSNQRDEQQDLNFWHEQVLAAAADESNGLQAVSQPGRFWEQLASDIFVANIQSQVWGWADTRATWLLDYWLEFEPRLNFILVVNSPEHALAHALLAHDRSVATDTVMQQWQLHHEELLRFFNRNPKRCLLVDADDCAQNTKALVAQCNQHWKLGLTPSDAPAIDLKPPGALAQYLAHQLSQHYPASADLQHEIVATATRFGAGPAATPGKAPDLGHIVDDYHLLLDRSAAQADLQVALLAQQILSAEQAQALEDLASAQNQVETNLEEQYLENEVLRSQHDQLQQQLEQQFHAAQALLSQLQTLQAAGQILDANNAELASELDVLTKIKAQLLDELESTKHKADSRQAEQQQEAEVLLLRLHQVQEELEQYFLQTQTLKGQLEAARTAEQSLVAEKAKLSEQFAANQATYQADLDKAKASLKTQLAQNQQQEAALAQTHQQQIAKLTAQYKEQQQEAEVLLLQLHQVQEELEQYFLQTQTLLGQLEAARTAEQSLVAEKAKLSQQFAENQAALKADLDKTKASLKTAEHAYTQSKSQLRAAEVALQADLEKAKTSLQAAQNESASLKTQLAQNQKQEAALAQTHQQQIAKLTAQYKEQQQELKRYSLQTQTLQGQLQAARTAEQSLVAEKAKLNQQFAENQAALKADLDKTKASLKAAQQDHTKSQSQLRAAEVALQADLEKAKTSLQAAQNESASLKTQLAQNQKQEAALAQTHQQQIAKLTAQYKEQQQEGEVLLLQLHQVQEELEHYFLQQQDAKRLLSGAEQRWQRMLERTPDYCDFESIEALPAEGSGQILWRIKNLHTTRRSFPLLEFKTLLQDGIASIVIEHASGAEGVLSRWPSDAADQTALAVQAAGKNMSPTLLKSLQQIGTSDWKLMQILVTLLRKALVAPLAIKAPDEFAPQLLQTGLDKLLIALQAFPPALRFDAVTLKREQVNPDYEHLWLGFSNLSLGSQHWPAFEFRFSCANVRPKRFGGHPKLEFPQTVSEAPFESWFEESYDDFGGKLELRFALPDSMDIDVWQQLSAADRTFLIALVHQLPAILGALQSAGTRLKRSWDDWTRMATEVQRVVALRCSALQAKAVPPVPSPPKLIEAPAPNPVQAKRPARKGAKK